MQQRPHTDEIHYKCLEYFNSQGLQIFAEHSVLESFSDDGLIVAKRKGIYGPDRVAISKGSSTCLV